jgi:hypothetical protein
MFKIRQQEKNISKSELMGKVKEHLYGEEVW